MEDCVAGKNLCAHFAAWTWGARGRWSGTLRNASWPLHSLRLAPTHLRLSSQRTVMDMLPTWDLLRQESWQVGWVFAQTECTGICNPHKHVINSWILQLLLYHSDWLLGLRCIFVNAVSYAYRNNGNTLILARPVHPCFQTRLGLKATVLMWYLLLCVNDISENVCWGLLSAENLRDIVSEQNLIYMYMTVNFFCKILYLLSTVPSVSVCIFQVTRYPERQMAVPTGQRTFL